MEAIDIYTMKNKKQTPKLSTYFQKEEKTACRLFSHLFLSVTSSNDEIHEQLNKTPEDEPLFWTCWRLLFGQYWVCLMKL